jgi:hypothetical protein
LDVVVKDICGLTGLTIITRTSQNQDPENIEHTDMVIAESLRKKLPKH